MTSDWAWLPGRDDPVVAGRIGSVDGRALQLRYGRSYLA